MDKFVSEVYFKRIFFEKKEKHYDTCYKVIRNVEVPRGRYMNINTLVNTFSPWIRKKGTAIYTKEPDSANTESRKTPKVTIINELLNCLIVLELTNRIRPRKCFLLENARKRN